MRKYDQKCGRREKIVHDHFRTYLSSPFSSKATSKRNFFIQSLRPRSSLSAPYQCDNHSIIGHEVWKYEGVFHHVPDEPYSYTKKSEKSLPPRAKKGTMKIRSFEL